MKSHKNKSFYEKYTKRLLDILCTMVALILLCWLYVVVGVLVRIKLGTPIIFRQKRPGLNGEIFTMYKFRTMTDERDSDGSLLPDGKRLTKFGSALRATSLDELPELFNILKGDMSIVGPRPLLPQYLDRYTDFQSRRHEVRPGITGLAQVNGRNSISWEEKFKLDVEYVDNLSLGMDLKIVLSTFVTVIKSEGITSDTSDTMNEFMGNGDEPNE